MFENQVCYIPTPLEYLYLQLEFFRQWIFQLDPHSQRSGSLSLKVAQYHLINNFLFRTNYVDVFLRRLEKAELERVLK